MNKQTFEIPSIGYSVKADWYQGIEEDQILLVLVGWTSTRANFEDLTSNIVEKTGTNALVLEYSGHGESQFELRDISPAQNFLEVVHAFDWLKARFPDATINVMGTSYGGFLATQLVKYRQFDNLILRVPAIYQPQDFYTPWAARIDNEDAYLRKERVFRTDKTALAAHPLFTKAPGFNGKTLVVVHELDQFVPKETTDAYCKAFHADKYFAKGFEHSFNVNASDEDKLAYQDAISDWLNNVSK